MRYINYFVLLDGSGHVTSTYRGRAFFERGARPRASECEISYAFWLGAAAEEID